MKRMIQRKTLYTNTLYSKLAKEIQPKKYLNSLKSAKNTERGTNTSMRLNVTWLFVSFTQSHPILVQLYDDRTLSFKITVPNNILLFDLTFICIIATGKQQDSTRINHIDYPCSIVIKCNSPTFSSPGGWYV